MKLLWVVFAVAISLGECRRYKSEDKGEVTSNCEDIDADSYLDRVLEKVRTELPDPIRLPPRSSIVELSDGLLWGISELSRVGPAKVICKDNTITMQATLTVDQLKGRYTWKKVRNNKSDKEGYVVILSDDFQAEVEIVVEKKENEETHPRLSKFVIKRLKKTDVQVSGGLLPWTVGEFLSWMSGLFSRAVASAVQDPITEALERNLREITID